MTWLIWLESPDPGRARTAEAVLRAWATRPDSHLLEMLEQALVWLHPAVAEPLTERILAAMDPAQLTDEDLVRWWTRPDQLPSFRLGQAVFRKLWPRLNEDRHHRLEKLLEEKMPAARPFAQWRQIQKNSNWA